MKDFVKALWFSVKAILFIVLHIVAFISVIALLEPVLL